MVQNIFLDTKLIDVVVSYYEPTTRSIRQKDGMSWLVITNSYIEEFLSLNTQALKEIDREHFKSKYQKTMQFGKFREITHFIYREHNNKIMYVDSMGPHLINSFMDFSSIHFMLSLTYFERLNIRKCL